jgi:hypothetical protein
VVFGELYWVRDMKSNWDFEVFGWILCSFVIFCEITADFLDFWYCGFHGCLKHEFVFKQNLRVNMNQSICFLINMKFLPL